MTGQSKPDQKLLADLARAKVLFQQRTVLAHMGKMPPGSNDGQEALDAQRGGE